jgi:hypothetical protein
MLKAHKYLDLQDALLRKQLKELKTKVSGCTSRLKIIKM